jgi:hypothetical protein
VWAEPMTPVNSSANSDYLGHQDTPLWPLWVDCSSGKSNSIFHLGQCFLSPGRDPRRFEVEHEGMMWGQPGPGDCTDLKSHWRSTVSSQSLNSTSLGLIFTPVKWCKTAFIVLWG